MSASAIEAFRRDGYVFVKGISDEANRMFAFRYLEYLSDAAQGLTHHRKPFPTTSSPAATLVRAELERILEKCGAVSN